MSKQVIEIITNLSKGKFLTLNGKPVSLSEVSDIMNTQKEEIERLNNIINELEEWLKYKKETLEEFDLGKRKETGAFWYTTTGEIEELLIKLQELKGDGSNKKNNS